MNNQDSSKKTPYTRKNFLRSLILGIINLGLYYLIGIIFNIGHEDVMIYVVMFFTFFFINFVLGNGNRNWKDFLTLKRRD